MRNGDDGPEWFDGYRVAPATVSGWMLTTPCSEVMKRIQTHSQRYQLCFALHQSLGNFLSSFDLVVGLKHWTLTALMTVCGTRPLMKQRRS